MSKVSVIIPAYNEGKRLVKMAGIVEFSGLADELIVVDDSSSNESKKELEKIKKARVIELAKNKGKSNALKIGFDKNLGPIVSRFLFSSSIFVSIAFICHLIFFRLKRI